ncbi:outer membrane beta-barrel family protein [Flavihumibacter cheonanensis]|uniref:outer membrane beta-barrel family protein n=1 Tax=Flavihumibacter cheonanensis TaxID=1442385 RepID=UPI001EF7977E|nr:outer membrane beta-barrel family protein [Flavihumibacter cheonanensis]MCG7752690.1 TonB-dependent receptor family protein [Flavihumibacter cheonanensis]
MRPGSLLTIFFLTFSLFLQAGTMVYDYPPIQVTVFNEKKEPLDFVSVRILQKADSGRVFSTVSDSTGNLALPDLKPGDYLLCVSRVDYEPACQDLIISANNTNTTPQILTIILHASTQLSTVTVTAKKPPVQFLSDRTVIRVDASINNAGTTALEVLERSPGITLDKDGNISLKGRDQVLVMIDNKPSYLTGAELNALLQGMSSNDIETIELIDNPPARYDAAGNGGIINIRLKKNRQRGFNGNLSLSGAQGIYPKSNNALSLNYYSGKVNLYTNYSMTINQNLLDMYAFRSYYADDDKTLLSTLEQPTFIQSTAKNHTLRTGMDYTLNKKTSLGIALAGTQIDRNGTGRGEASWKSANNLPDSLIRTRNSNSTDWKNASINLNLRHQFSAKQELTADLDWLGYQIKGSQGFQNIRSDNNSYMESFLGELPSKIRILSFKADHQLQLPKQYKLETGVKWAATSTNNKAAYTINQGGGWEEDLGKSNQFLYDEQIRAAYASLERKINRWWYQVGLRYEHTSFDAHQLGNAVIKDSAFSNQYGSLFPSLQASVELDSLNELSLTMNKRIDRPPYQQLNPFVFIINKYTYQKGNPLMKPQFTYTVELSHRYKNLLSTSVSYSDTRDYFSQIFLSDSTGTFYYSEGNLGRRKILGLSVSFSEQLLPFWNFSSQADLQHKKLKGFVWKPLEASITQISISINNQFKLGKGWAMEASGFWISRSQADIQEVVEPTGQVGVGISKQVLKKKGSLKLTARDIFYTQDMEGFTIFNQATEYFRLQRDTRVINLAFTWRFGKQTKTTPRRTNKVDEADRVSG